MKKFLTMLIALIMVLSSVPALADKLEIATAALEESRNALEQQLAAENALRVELEEKTACVAALEGEKAARTALQDRLNELEAELAARKEDLRALTAELAVKDGEKTALEAEVARLRQPAETAKRVVEAVPELVRSAVDAVPDSVRENLAETAETAKRKVVAIHRKVTEWSRKEQEGPEIPEEDILVDSEMAPEQPGPEYRPQPETMTPEALLEKCKTRLGEVAREFNELYQAVVKLENREQQEPARSRSKLGHLSSIKEILDRVRSLGEKK